jgi:uncharacterized small protein (DUF1192 family)
VRKILADYLKTDIGGLRAMAKEGKITTEIMVKAFAGAAGQIDAEFAKMQPTISQAMTDLRTVFGKLLSDSNKSAEGTKSVAAEIRKLAETIDTNRNGIIELFAQIISLATKAATAVGNIGQSMQGWAAVNRGDLNFFKFATMGAKELQEWLAKNNTEVKRLENELTRKQEQLGYAESLKTGAGTPQLKAIYAKRIAELQIEITTLQAALNAAGQPKTTAPTGGGSLGTSPTKPSEEAKKQADAIKKVIENLKFERDQMLRNDREQAIANALKQAGVDINSKYGQQIAQLAGKNFDLAQETKLAKEESEAYVKAAGEWEKEKQAAIDAIDKEIESLKEEAETFGKTAKEVSLYKLSLQGATPEQLKLAEALLETIERQERLQSIYGGLSTAQDEYNKTVKDLAIAYADLSIPLEEYVRLMGIAQEKLADATKDQKDELTDLQKAIDGWGKDSAQAIADFAIDGKASFSDMANSIIKDILKMIIYQQMMEPLFTSLGKSAGSGTFFGNLFGGGKARGGPVSGGRMYEVNERGTPELLSVGNRHFLMMAGQSGHVAAAKNIERSGGGSGGAGANVTVNVTNNAGAEVSTQARETSSGIELDVLIDKAVASKLGQFGSSSNKVMRQNFNTSQRLISR